MQHILSSAHPSGKAVVWDLRKNEPIIQVSAHGSRVSVGRDLCSLLSSPHGSTSWDFCPMLPQILPLIKITWEVTQNPGRSFDAAFLIPSPNWCFSPRRGPRSTYHVGPSFMFLRGLCFAPDALLRPGLAPGHRHPVGAVLRRRCTPCDPAVGPALCLFPDEGSREPQQVAVQTHPAGRGG